MSRLKVGRVIASSRDRWLQPTIPKHHGLQAIGRVNYQAHVPARLKPITPPQGDDDADAHGRLRKKGGNQEMHFQGLRQANDCISTASDGHLCHGMLELLFLRRGACLRKKEKALFVSLATIRYLSRVCTRIQTSLLEHV